MTVSTDWNGTLKFLAFIPILIVIVVGILFAVCKVMGLHFYAREILSAATICIFSGELALLPAVLLRKADSGTVSQAGLVGTVVHMFLTLLLSAIVWMGKIVEHRSAFIFALLASFWISLLILVLLLAKLIRLAGNKNTKV